MTSDVSSTPNTDLVELRVHPQRKAGGWVTIVHLTDLHFPPLDSDRGRLALNPDIKQARWHMLAAEIAMQKPDLICVTGDLADNPVSEWLRSTPDVVNRLRGAFRMRRKSAGWDEALGKTFLRVKAFLDILRDECKLDQSRVLVIPGNHDLRMQGLLAFGATVQKARKQFDKAFGKQQIQSLFCFADPGSSDQTRGLITVKVVGFDSNTTKPIANFAAGYLDSKQREGFAFFENAAIDARQLRAQAAEFRVCLVHHHPLPVVAAERPTYADGAGKLEDVVDSEQGMVFNNAGTFLHSANESAVDLVLHGHRHHSQFTVVRYPRGGEDHSMFVAGGGSIGEETRGQASYNVIRLRATGNVGVVQRTREISAIEKYQERQAAELYPEYALTRLARRVWLAARDRKACESGKAPPNGIGIARCARLSRAVEIFMDGSAHYVVELDGLCAATPGATVPSLPLNVSVAEHSLVTLRTVTRRNPSSCNVQPSFEPDSAEDRVGKWRIAFTPELAYEDRLDLRYEITIYNVYDFVSEYARARAGSPSRESSAICALVIDCAKLVQSISFPLSWQFEPMPRLRVMDDAGVEAQEEFEFHAANFKYQSANRTASVVIDRPLPGFQYRVEWLLQEKNEFERRYAAGTLNRFRQHTNAILAEAAVATLRQKLLDFRAANSSTACGNLGPMLSRQCEISVFIVREAEQNAAGVRSVVASLQRVVDTRADVPMRSWPAGVSLAGHAHRSGCAQYFNVHTEAIVNCEAYRRGESAAPFIALWAVPLLLTLIPNEASGGAVDSAVTGLVYAVVCLGCRSDDGSLNPTDPQCKNFTSKIQSELGAALVEALDYR